MAVSPSQVLPEKLEILCTLQCAALNVCEIDVLSLLLDYNTVLHTTRQASGESNIIIGQSIHLYVCLFTQISTKCSVNTDSYF